MKRILLLGLMTSLAIFQASATDAFREHRYDMFHALPVRSTDIVMMGNSITDMPIWPEFFSGTCGRVINRGTSGGYSYEMLDNIESVLAGHPAKIFMKIGTNDLGNSKGYGESIAANVRACVAKTKAMSPNTEFYIESILPAYNAGYRTPQTIATANTLLKAIADEDPNDKVYWVELNSLYGGTTLSSAYSQDGLHLNANGYRIWCNAIVGNLGVGASVVIPNNISSTMTYCGLPHPNGQRNSYFSAVPVANDNILVIGDEMIKCGEWQELLGNDKVLNRGYGWGYGGSISVINSSLSAIFNGAIPKAVYLYTGTEDLNNGAYALATNKAAYTTLLNNIKARMNGGKIVLLGNQPINDANINANSIKPFNQWLASVAAADAQVDYIDLYTPFVNSGTDNMNTRYLKQGDGKAYLYGLGYAKVAELMKPSFDVITGLDNDIVTVAEAEANIAALNATSCDNPGDTALYTLTNHQQNGTTYALYVANGTLTVGDANVAAVSFGDAALFTREIYGSKWAFKNKATGQYLIWRGHNEGYNDNKGVLDTYNAAYCNFTPVASNGGYYLVGKRNDGSTDGTWVLSAGGAWNKWGNSVCWQSDYSNIFTIDLADPEAEHTIDKNNGAWTATNESGSWASRWTSSDGLITFSSNLNNMQWAVNDANHIDARSGTAKSATYTLASTNPKYVIDSYSFKAKAVSYNQTWVQNGRSYTVTSATATTFAGVDVGEQSVTFSLTGENSGTVLTEFYVKLKKVDESTVLVEPEKVTVFDNAHSSIPYRIPAIASTKDGVLVVAADYRFTKNDIGGGRLDLHIRRSFDYGKTWESNIIKPSNMVGNGRLDNDAAGFGDPCIVADRESNKMMILSCAGYPGFFQCTRNQHQRCARWYSEDNGATWTGPDFIDNQFVFEPLDATSFGPAQGMFFGSGKIHQSRYVKVKDYYRLYASNSVRNSNNVIRNYVMYSDDFGLTWNFLGGVNNPAVTSGGDEPKVEELPDGSVLFSGRRNNLGGRHFNIFRFTNAEKAEGQWLGTAAVSNASVGGITNDNACNGEIQLVPVIRKKDNAKMWLALQSVPFGSGRSNVGIFYKPLASEADYSSPTAIASNWEGKHQSSWTTSCYSTMVLQGDKNIGFVYEENGPSDGGYDIQYKRYSIEVITNGKYAFDPDYETTDVVLPLQAAIITPAEGTVGEVRSITVQYNKNLTLKRARVTLSDGVTATASVRDNVLTLTLDAALTGSGKYVLTVPAGIVADKDAQENPAVRLTYRIIADERPLGAKVTSLEGISNYKTYALYNPASHAYAVYAPQYSSTAMWVGEMQDIDYDHRVSQNSYRDDVNFANPNSSWMVVSYKGSTYLYNVGAEKFVTVGRPTSFGNPRAISVSEIGNGFAFNTEGGVQQFMCAAPQLTDPVAVWTNNDDGSCWQLFENPNIEEEYERCISFIDSGFILGDADGNTIVNTEDVGTLVDYILERRKNEAPAQADVNKDTQISVGDVTKLVDRLLYPLKR